MPSRSAPRAGAKPQVITWRLTGRAKSRGHRFEWGDHRVKKTPGTANRRPAYLPLRQAYGEVPVYEASLLKVLSNEVRVKLCGEALQMLGERGLIRKGSAGALTDPSGDTIEHQLRDAATNLFGGGSNDVQRDIIGFHGLGLPR